MVYGPAMTVLSLGGHATVVMADMSTCTPPPQMCSLTSWPNKCEAKCQGFVLYKCDTRGWTATAAAAAKQQKALAIETLLRSTNRRRHAIL
jgi:hypothetical protein